jgi:hypothetical protein
MTDAHNEHLSFCLMTLQLPKHLHNKSFEHNRGIHSSITLNNGVEFFDSYLL